ncbi:hypothetical protein Htur_0009 [Haloterrigena turkmenica DSM 5511]|uniref:Uncharacterized protein n=1 Tax=Haloterrigena turkmenica (strain ATCC 51198 / DSM 5511 / JCM 9101 / NCIMB 13204 / VKM B-1734 / 4k) TaxID=543526 RepID=D2RST6_HALTV|nr:hypothetical protein Htur_0009 [Haloterrigena turkmenica DSM 5511]
MLEREPDGRPTATSQVAIIATADKNAPLVEPT